MNPNLLQILFSSIPAVLGTLATGGIAPPLVASLTGNLLGPVESLIASIKSGQSKTADALAALAALSGVIAVLKSQPNLPADKLTMIENVDKDVTAALKAYAAAENGYDQSLYLPIAPVQ